MPVATMQLVTQLLIFIIHCRTAQLIQVVLEGDRAVIANHQMPLGDDTGVFDALIVGGRAIIMGVVDTEAPPTILPQGAIPFSMIWLFVATFEAVGEGGTFVLVSLVFRNGAQLQTVFAFDVTPLVFWWPLSSEDAG